jgi:hypothetical protein
MSHLSKFSNLHLTRGQVLFSKTGAFNAIVRLSRPEYRPDYMKILGQFTPGFMSAQIGCDALDRAEADSNILSVELREHLSDLSPAH